MVLFVHTSTPTERTPLMLVLSRRLSEKLLFPGLNVAVQILSIKGNVVRLGIDAPRDVAVLREELLGKPMTAAPHRLLDADVVASAARGD
jgi:carbon storage regulator CsrA